MLYVLIIFIGYLLGCSSMSYYISCLKKVDIRTKGSKNLGASNTVLILGWKAGILVGIHDIAKGSIAVLLANYLFPSVPYAGAIAGVACVLGHIFPFYLKFKGGKGFAAYLGMTLALNWKFALIILLLVVLITLITDYIVLATATTILSVPTYLGFESRSYVLPLILLIATIVILFKHRENFVRIYKGTEIGFRSANRGEHR